MICSTSESLTGVEGQSHFDKYLLCTPDKYKFLDRNRKVSITFFVEESMSLNRKCFT